MVERLLVGAALIVAGLASGPGCGQTTFPADLGLTLSDVDAVRNDDGLEPAEKRAALAAYGLDPVIINGLLAAERLANQFGGDLASAYDKVVNDRLAELTPDEVQYYGDATAITTYGDAEAQAIVDLFREHEIDSADELEAYLDDPANTLPAGIDEENLRGVFLETSPDDVQDELL